MSPKRDWILYLTVIVALSLALAGTFMYPLNTAELGVILGYELAVIAGVLVIMFLIHKKGIE
jgi:hypothetical protein